MILHCDFLIRLTCGFMQRRRGRKLSSFFSDKERREYERKKDRKEYRIDDRKEKRKKKARN